MERRNELIRVPFLISFSSPSLVFENPNGERERERGKERRCCSDCRVHRVYFLSRVLSREIYLGQVNS